MSSNKSTLLDICKLNKPGGSSGVVSLCFFFIVLVFVLFIYKMNHTVWIITHSHRENDPHNVTWLL